MKPLRLYKSRPRGFVVAEKLDPDGFRRVRKSRAFRKTPTERLLPSPQARSLAALAFHDLVALLDKPLAFAVFAFLLLLDVGASFIRHRISRNARMAKPRVRLHLTLRYTVSSFQEYISEVVSCLTLSIIPPRTATNSPSMAISPAPITNWRMASSPSPTPKCRRNWAGAASARNW